MVISHVWPEESEETFERLIIPGATILHWGENDVLRRRDWAGVYSCPVVVVREFEQRHFMPYVLGHELYHAHQDSVTPGRCTKLRWVETEEGKAYIEAWEADLEADRLFPRDTVEHYEDDPIENSAEFYAWWTGKTPSGSPYEDLCIAHARCQFMEDPYGPRPDG